MDNTILIPEGYRIKILVCGDTIYCLDALKPFVLKITDDVKKIFDDFKGETISYIKHHNKGSDRAIQEILKLKDKGFFNNNIQIEQQELAGINKICLAVSYNCNFSCLYCYNNTKADNTSVSLMTATTARRAIDFLSDNSSKDTLAIDFFGGEPLLNFNVINIAADHCRSKKKDIKFSITTNATLITPSIAEFLKVNDFKVVVSIDGSENIHNQVRKYRNGKDSYESVIKGIDILRQYIAAEKLTYNVVATKLFPYAEKIVSELQERGMSNISLNTVSAPGSSQLDINETTMQCLMESEEQIFKKLLTLDTILHVRYLPFIQIMKIFAQGKKKMLRCGVYTDLAISAEGNFYPCHRFIGDNKFRLGDLWKGLLEEEREKSYLSYSEYHTKCDSCWGRYICGGPCLYDSYAYTGSINGIAELKCKRTLRLIELSAMLYGELIKRNKEMLKEYLSS